LQTWDYGSNGMYFITICTKDRECFFGGVVETRCFASLSDMPEFEMKLNDLGKKVESEWLKTPELRPDMNLELAEYVVMPNHFHGIILIGENKYNSDYSKHFDGSVAHHVSPIGTIDDSPQNRFGNQSKNLASIVGGLNRPSQHTPGKTKFHLPGKHDFTIT
jgi:putative transposase